MALPSISPEADAEKPDSKNDSVHTLIPVITKCRSVPGAADQKIQDRRVAPSNKIRLEVAKHYTERTLQETNEHVLKPNNEFQKVIRSEVLDKLKDQL